MVGMVVYQYILRIMASEGNKEAAETLILGVYRAIFWFVCFITLVAAVPYTYYRSKEGDDGDFDQPAILTASIWASHHFAFEGIAFLLLHNGVGKRALFRSFYFAFLWAAVTFMAVFMVVGKGFDMDAVLQVQKRENDDELYLTSIAIASTYSCLLIMFYGTLVFAPPSMIHQRPALKLYSIYWLIYESITMFDVMLTSTNQGWPFCLECFNKWFVFGCLEPFIILRTLRSDCLYWQGMYSPDEHSLNAPLMGGMGFLRRDSVECIAGVLTDMRMVKQIPYGMVTFEDKRVFAAGASARVYKGLLYNAVYKRKDTVAIKMLFCMELNSEVISRFGQEVQLLNSMKHPNVVKCEGICIMPPALCMVTEYCSHGSLYDFIHRDNKCAGLDWNTKVQMMIDATKGVNYLHDLQIPPHNLGILHGDIKSLNFLVTDNLVVKLSDLGEHRMIGEEVDEVNYPVPKNRSWSPPEILSGNYTSYHVSSDIYSLGMVLSEIILGEVPFDTQELRRLSHNEFYKHVYKNENRPDLSKAIGGPIGKPMEDCLKSTWFSDTQYRCTTKEMLEVFNECFHNTSTKVHFLERHQSIYLNDEVGGGVGVGVGAGGVGGGGDDDEGIADEEKRLLPHTTG
ncbi:hypothetical protein TrVE_jg8193 [Triparma verrucosa]|uniref:Protein kinase domain-containing protein n=1 Tax=Triparma verrucosa TaxID=1606542 RepID=A0A9W7CI19_9STRA|nr:hypothetical protein TrVE_jg8193 [Triparma verrucosa]